MIPDITWASNRMNTLVTTWANSQADRGDFDHALIMASLNIDSPEFTATLRLQKANWDVSRHLFTGFTDHTSTNTINEAN